MADSQVITIPLCLPRNEAAAFVRILNRIGPEHCACFAPSIDIEVSMSAATRLLGALAGADFKAEG